MDSYVCTPVLHWNLHEEDISVSVSLMDQFHHTIFEMVVVLLVFGIWTLMVYSQLNYFHY